MAESKQVEAAEAKAEKAAEEAAQAAEKAAEVKAKVKAPKVKVGDIVLLNWGQQEGENARPSVVVTVVRDGVVDLVDLTGGYGRQEGLQHASLDVAEGDLSWSELK